MAKLTPPDSVSRTGDGQSAAGAPAPRTRADPGARGVPGGGAVASPDAAASRILETAPLVMRMLRLQLRRRSGDSLTVPRFHALLYIRRHPGTGLSEVADYVGATLPATSELVNRLVAAGFVSRLPNDAERRRLCLTLTEAGEEELEATRAEAHLALQAVLERMSPEHLGRLVLALDDLRALLVPEAG